jgi:hypothetical protein
MRAARIVVCTALLLKLSFSVCAAQQPKKQQRTPVAVEWTVDAATPLQRVAIKSVFLLYCPNSHMKGTGFLLTTGLIVTNNHVVEGCTAQEMKASPFSGQEFGFDKMATDSDVDLALLHPSTHLAGGLDLGSDQDPDLGTEVNTWGFPLSYNGPAPLLSIGYVAGYVREGEDGKEVKHVVVNGAFNPGNSGGPLFRWKDNKVVGVVVAKFHLYPPFVEQIIASMSKMSSGVVHGLLDANGRPKLDENGKPVTVSESQITAAVLEQFYKTTQVMIGEAISVSELRAFLSKKQGEVR